MNVNLTCLTRCHKRYMYPSSYIHNNLYLHKTFKLSSIFICFLKFMMSHVYPSPPPTDEKYGLVWFGLVLISHGGLIC